MGSPWNDMLVVRWLLLGLISCYMLLLDDMWFRNKKFRFLGSLTSWGHSQPSHRKLVHMLREPTNINETAHMMGQYWWGKRGSGFFDFQLAYIILDGQAPPIEEMEWPILKNLVATFG